MKTIELDQVGYVMRACDRLLDELEHDRRCRLHQSPASNVAEEVLRRAIKQLKAGARLSPLRPDDEVQRAHDIVWSQLMGETPFVLDAKSRPLMHVAIDVLCWVLQHDHSDGFTRTLETIEKGLADRGFELRKEDKPFIGFRPATVEGGVS